MGKLVTEAIATFLLVLVILMPGAGAIGIGAVLIALVYMGAPVSGAHYNPAVTLGFLLRGKIRLGEAIGYVIVQFGGAMLAAGTAWCLLETPATIEANAGSSPHQWMLVEIIFTFALCLVYFNVEAEGRRPGNDYFGIAIGLTVTAGIFAGSRISGAAFNPAVGLGPNLVAAMDGNTKCLTPAIWLYTAGPFIGSILAVIATKLQGPHDSGPHDSGPRDSGPRTSAKNG